MGAAETVPPVQLAPSLAAVAAFAAAPAVVQEVDAGGDVEDGAGGRLRLRRGGGRGGGIEDEVDEGRGAR